MQPVAAQASMVSDPGFGEKWHESSARYDPELSSWKTHHCLWDEDLPWSSVTLPRWGLMLNGLVYQRKTAERPISATGSGYLPTITASSYGTNKSNGQSAPRPSLQTMAARALWPTPVASEAGAGPRKPDGKRGARLTDIVGNPSMWPTPTVHGNHNRKGASKKSGDGLATAVKAFATPTSRDWRSGKASQKTMERNSRPLSEQIGGQLNPTWVEWLMGWPIGWTGLRPLEMAKFREWQQQHSAFFQEQATMSNDNQAAQAEQEEGE